MAATCICVSPRGRSFPPRRCAGATCRPAAYQQYLGQNSWTSLNFLTTDFICRLSCSHFTPSSSHHTPRPATYSHQAIGKRGISKVEPTDSPGSFRPAQKPYSYLSSLLVESSHKTISGTAGERVELPQFQVQLADTTTRRASAPSAFMSPNANGLHPMQAGMQSGMHGLQAHGQEVPGVQGQEQGQEQGLQNYNIKLREYQTQLERLHTLQAELQVLQSREVQGGVQGGRGDDLQSRGQDSFGSRTSALPSADTSTEADVAYDEAQMEAQLQLALFSDEAGSSLSPLRSCDSESGAPNYSVAEGEAHQAHSPDGYTPEEFANALLEGDASTDEFGIDIASAIETWKANQAAGGGVADESLDVSRSSTVCRGLQGLGLEREQILAEELEQAENLLTAVSAPPATNDLR